MFNMMTFDNTKKIVKVTKLNKRWIRLADRLNYDVGMDGHKLCIAFDANDVFKPYVLIGRELFGFTVFAVNHDSNNEYIYKVFDNQNDAFFFALGLLP